MKFSRVVFFALMFSANLHANDNYVQEIKELKEERAELGREIKKLKEREELLKVLASKETVENVKHMIYCAGAVAVAIRLISFLENAYLKNK